MALLQQNREESGNEHHRDVVSISHGLGKSDCKALGRKCLEFVLGRDLNGKAQCSLVQRLH